MCAWAPFVCETVEGHSPFERHGAKLGPARLADQCFLGGGVCRIGIPSIARWKGREGRGWSEEDGSGRAAKPFLSDMASKGDRTEARVKAGGMRCRSAARLYARRSAGKINLVGKEGEDRLAILSFTLLSLKVATW